MIYDCLIIGGGLAGLTCGIRCASEGLHTAIISGGMNSLHFSSGSIDIAGYTTKGEIVKKPFEYMKSIISDSKEHPYSKTGIQTVRKSLDFITREMADEGIVLNHNSEMNHFHVTALGTLKPTYLSQESVFSSRAAELISSGKKIAILNFEGFRDYYPEQTAANLKKNSLFRDKEIIQGRISLPYYLETEKNLHEFRSTDIARIFETETYLPRIAVEIKKASQDAEAVSLPAFIGINNYRAIRERLEELTGKYIYEIPTLPPSILGLRLDHALKNRFIRYGGEYIAGTKAVTGSVNGNMVDFVTTQNSGQVPVRARYYMLASGSFFSGGLKAGFNSITEPVFDLRVNSGRKREKWYSNSLFDAKSQPFLNFGIETDKNLNPLTGKSIPVKNLFCAGSVLSGYNPVSEGCGGGVAISTAYQCAERIIRGIKNDKKR